MGVKGPGPGLTLRKTMKATFLLLLRLGLRRLLSVSFCSILLTASPWSATAGERWDWSQRPPAVAWRAEIGAGFANVASASHRDDGLELRDALASEATRMMEQYQVRATI